VNGDWSYWLREHKGTLLAFAAFVVMFTIYAANHPMGLNANVATTAANKGVLLAVVAMAQTLVVLTSGIDLSVGMVMVLANCLASSIVVGSPLATGLGVVGVLLTGCVCGAINGLIVIYGRLQPIVTTIATGAVYYGIALALRPVPGGDVNAALADALTGQLPGGVPASLAVLLALVAIVWLPFRRSAIGRAAYAAIETLPAARAQRREQFQRYDRLISASTADVRTIQRRDDDSCLMYVIRVAATARDKVRAAMASAGVATSVHYPSLARHPLFGDGRADAFCGRQDECVITLPTFAELTSDEQRRVVGALALALNGLGSAAPVNAGPHAMTLR
jgi:hypothetical protein